MHCSIRRLAALTCVPALALLFGSCAQNLASPAPATSAAPSPEIDALLARIDSAYAAARTMSADFRYTVKSDVRNQEVIGHARLMKPNYARLTFTRIAEPAFPNLIGSDGYMTYTYVPKNFRGGRNPISTPLNPEFRTPADPTAPREISTRSAVSDRILTNRTFEPGPHDPDLAARQASGLAGGGLIDATVTDPRGRDLRLWDSIALHAFFDPRVALRMLYFRVPSELKMDAPQTINGVTYMVIYHRYETGNIEGGELSAFDQRVFVGPDNLIHRYELRFVSNGKPGVQLMELSNVRINEPMPVESFSFTPPR